MTDIKDVCEFIKKCGVYYLATVENDQPRNRPFGTINLFEGKLYIQTGKVKEVSKQIQKNPKVEISCCAGPEWLRLCGELVRDDRLEAKEDMLNHYPDLKNMYSATDDNTEVLYFKNATATLYSFTAAPQVVKF